MDATTAVKCINQSPMPKLRKNRRIESRWGVKYHTAVKNAVFGIQPAPYMPTESPPSLSEYVPEVQTLYVCKQCKDCFRFLSSFEDHNTRRSWILGYWCQHCFLTICTHMSTEGSPCAVCVKLDRNKRSYLRGKGLHKSQKLGAIRVFYNQCQFFAHLRSHYVSLVDMGDLMLMPLPTNMGNDWSPELDIVCEALMEHAFMLRIHIMDWLKSKNVDNNWWQLATNNVGSNDDPVSKIIKDYKGRFFFNSGATTTKEQPTIINPSCFVKTDNGMSPENEIVDSTENIDKRKKLSGTDIRTSLSEENIIEHEDNPCTVTDIAFVDCGPASKCFEPEAPVNNISRKHTTIFVKSSQDSTNTFQPANIVKLNNRRKRLKSVLKSCNSSDMALSYGNTTITPKPSKKDSSNESVDPQIWKDIAVQSVKGKTPVKILPKSNNIKPDSDAKLNKAVSGSPMNTEPPQNAKSDALSSQTKMQMAKTKAEKSTKNVHTVTVNSGQKILTFQSPKNVDLSTIINQLPPHLVNSKRIVFIGQDPDGVTVHSKQDPNAKKMLQVVPDASFGKGTKTLQTKVVPLNISDDLNKDACNIISKLQSDTVATKTEQTSPTNKIIYQNGRKYLIKQSSLLKNTPSVPNLKVLAKDAQNVKQGLSENIGSTVMPTNSTESENTVTPEKINIPHTDISPLTPSPSPSELSNGSSCDIQSKQISVVAKNVQKIDTSVSQKTFDYLDAGSALINAKDSLENLSFYKGEDENLYLNVKLFIQKPSQTIADTCTMITKCKQEMLNEFFHLSNVELKRRYEHLQNIHDEILNVMNFVAPNVIKENLKAVNILQHVLKHCIEKCNHYSVDCTGNGDVVLNEWESEYENCKEKPKCSTCDKTIKPKSYIPGFSKPAKDDSIYCSCYKLVCHKCLTYQGNSTRFVAHQNFHRKDKPYICPDCFRKFTTFKALEVHTWTVCFHTLKKQVFGCKICEIDGFRDMESIARHFAIMHSYNKLACDICYIVLPSYSEYKKHSREVHSITENQEPIRLVLCKLGQCIMRCENYMSHMEKHLVVQRLLWFKCPFCPFINLEAKRIMSHFQSKHLERLPEILSPGTLWDVLPVDLAINLLKINPQLSSDNTITKFVNAHEDPCEDGTLLPKIINTRTITSEVFERGAQEGDDDLTTDVGNSPSGRSPFKGDGESKVWSSDYGSPESSKIDSESKSETLDVHKVVGIPKILDVRSIADVPKVSDSPIKSSTKTFMNEDDEVQCKLEDKEKIESRGPRERSEENTKTMEDSSKSETEKIRGNISKSEITLSEVDKSTIDLFSLQHFLLGSKTPTEFKLSAEQTRKRESSVERNTDQEKDDTPLSEAQLKKEIENIVHTPTISKPPPLARIPKHVLELNTPKKPEVPPIKAPKEKSTHSSRNHRTNRQSPRRIALNGPVSSAESGHNYSCHLCGEMINTSWSIVSAHFEKKHAQDYTLSILTPKLLRISPEFINGGYKELFGSKKRKSDVVATNTKRRRRWTPKKYAEGKTMNSPGTGLCVQQETAEDGEGNFKCKKCNQRCTDMADLREHIASNHRIKGRYLICLECGENFVVAPSLQMHLKAFHGIEDPITYMTQNTSYAPDSVQELEVEGKTAVANQCHVCMAVFEDKAAVDKHLRVHGMAFLNRKRIEARNALRSPEKRSKAEEEKKESQIKDSPKETVRKDKPAETILEKINASI